MHETPGDLASLQKLLDDSYARAGDFLKSVIPDDFTADADEICSRLTGVCLLTLATVTADGRPLAGPVDGLFYRGRFWFGTGSRSVRAGHIRMRPSVSAVHVPAEAFSVTVHGVAEIMDLRSPENDGFRDYVLDVYGPSWNEWGAGATYARIDPDRMFTFLMPDEG